MECSHPSPPRKTSPLVTKKHKQVISELIETEETYTRQLSLLMEIYVSPLQRNKIIKDEQHAKLFPDVAIILGLNSNLLISRSPCFPGGIESYELFSSPPATQI